LPAQAATPFEQGQKLLIQRWGSIMLNGCPKKSNDNVANYIQCADYSSVLL